MESDAAIMIVSVVNSGFVEHSVFASGRSLHFMVDRQIYSFEATGFYDKEQGAGPLGVYTVDLQKYRITKEFLKVLLDAKQVVVKIDLVENKYVEGGFTSVRAGLADFYQQAF